MALPQILEMDPWLEEEEENYMKAADVLLNSKFSNEDEREQKGYNLTSTVITAVKISFNSYLVFKLVSRSATIRNLVLSAVKQPSKLGMILMFLGVLFVGFGNIWKVVRRVS